MTEYSVKALNGLRDMSNFQWYVIPLLAIVMYIYSAELRKAGKSGNYDAIFAGLTLFGMDFINETWNGWVLNLTGYSAFWTAPGPTALRTMVGWNIEIMFMFSIAGIIFYNTCPDSRKMFGIPGRWLWAVIYAAFCVVVECFLNAGGALVWVYPFWNFSITGIWLIFFIGYFHFFVAVILVLSLKKTTSKVIAVGGIYMTAILANVIAMGFLGWKY